MLSLLPHSCPHLEGISQQAGQQRIFTWCDNAFASSVFYPGHIASDREGKCSPTPSLSFSSLEHCPINLVGPYCNSAGSPSSPNPHDPVTIRALVWIYPRDAIIVLAKFMSLNVSLPSVFYFLLAGRSAKLFPLINDNTQSSIFKNCTQEHDLLFMHSLIHFSISECLLHASHCASDWRLCMEQNR